MANKISSFRGNPTILNKIIVTLVYLTLGYTVTVTPPSSIISIYFILGLLYMLFIHRQKGSVKYFVRYHLIQALFLNITISMLMWLLLAMIGLFESLPFLTMLMTVIRYYLFQFELYAVPSGTFSPTVINVAVMMIALVTSFYALRGQLTQLPYISDGVRRFD